tara:strand:- start:183 stop:2207 length:2025 start_codon:yes stop_codon:yes gene_type:complete
MSYHNTSSVAQRTTNTQGQTAPTGYHYMPDGSLMSDVEHAKLYGEKIIKDFVLDTSGIKEIGERRKFTILGDKGAVFSLQIKEGVNYYNFKTGLFQTAPTKLANVSIPGDSYKGNINFPKVAAGAQYDIYLFSENSTKHAEYKEVRFPDNRIDVNSTTGSNSNLIQKVIYQTLDVTVTLGTYAPNGTVTGTLSATKVITTPRNGSVPLTPFSFIVTTGTSNTLTINKQPTSNDVMAFITATPAAAPLDIEGEDLYPAVTQTDVVNGDFSAGTTHKIVMDNNVASKMVVGDRVTIATTALTDTVDGAITLSNRVVMDNNVVTKMAVGDRVTIRSVVADTIVRADPIFQTDIVTVTALDPDGDNAKEFEVSAKVTIGDGSTLEFESKLNREVITVAALNPDTDNAKEFSMKDVDGNSVNVGILDNTTLSFSNQRNYRWSFDNIYNLAAGMRQLKSTYFTSQPTIKEYLTQTTVNEGQPDEYKVDNVRIPALEPAGTATTSSAPVATRDGTTKVETIAQTGNVTFSQQALLTFGGGANATIFSYGTSEIESLTGHDVEFTDLAVALTEISTTTTEVVSNSTSVPITNRIGISDTISSVSGIGIDSSVANPTVASGAGSVTGGGTIVLSAAQTLESGVTLTFPGAGSVATITGNIKINKAGNENVVLRFDLEKFLSMQ